MHFDLAKIPPAEAYKLLVGTVVPRPIALTTTVDCDGRVNAAPFSFFNAVSANPPVVVLGITAGTSRRTATRTRPAISGTPANSSSIWSTRGSRSG